MSRGGASFRVVVVVMGRMMVFQSIISWARTKGVKSEMRGPKKEYIYKWLNVSAKMMREYISIHDHRWTIIPFPFQRLIFARDGGRCVREMDCFLSLGNSWIFSCWEVGQWYARVFHWSRVDDVIFDSSFFIFFFFLFNFFFE